MHTEVRYRVAEILLTPEVFLIVLYTVRKQFAASSCALRLFLTHKDSLDLRATSCLAETLDGILNCVLIDRQQPRHAVHRIEALFVGLPSPDAKFLEYLLILVGLHEHVG